MAPSGSGPIHHPDLQQEAIFTEELVLVTSPAIRSIKDLAKIADLKTIVFQRGCSYRQRLETLLAGLGIVVAVPLEFGSLDAIISCAGAGVGITLLPRGVRGVRISRPNASPCIGCRANKRAGTVFIRRTDAYVSSALAAFWISRGAFIACRKGDRAPVPISTLAPRKRGL